MIAILKFNIPKMLFFHFLIKYGVNNMQYLRTLREVNEDFGVIKYFLRGASEHIFHKLL